MQGSPGGTEYGSKTKEAKRIQVHLDSRGLRRGRRGVVAPEEGVSPIRGFWAERRRQEAVTEMQGVRSA